MFGKKLGQGLSAPAFIGPGNSFVCLHGWNQFGYSLSIALLLSIAATVIVNKKWRRDWNCQPKKGLANTLKEKEVHTWMKIFNLYGLNLNLQIVIETAAYEGGNIEALLWAVALIWMEYLNVYPIVIVCFAFFYFFIFGNINIGKGN